MGTRRITITLHDADHDPVSGATVSGDWSGGFAGSDSCITGGSGQCSVISDEVGKKNSSMTFTVSGVSASGLTYEAGVNHDPDGDSSGTAITVVKP